MSRIRNAITRAARRHGIHQQNAPQFTVPAPVSGLNTRDPLALMDAQYATHLVNYFPEDGALHLRRGFQPAVTGLAGQVESLFTYHSGVQSELIAFAGGNMYRTAPVVAPGGAVTVIADPDPVVSTGITRSRWRAANFNGGMVFVNGADSPLQINPQGALSPHGLSGSYQGSALDPADLTAVLPFKNRLYFLEKESPRFWYGGVSHIQGELTAFDTSTVLHRGGNLAAIGSLTLDSGQGVDDLLCLISDTGEALLYSGTDPSMAERWSLAGSIQVGIPVGDQPLVNLGADLICITDVGFVRILPYLSQTDPGRILKLSDLIQSAVVENVRDNEGQSGWQAIFYPHAKWLLFNVPEGNGFSHQLVQNTQTGAWCQFNDMHASSWEVFEDHLYFGGRDGTVSVADSGQTDNGEAIRGSIRSAPNRFGSPAVKHVDLMRPYFQTDGDVSLSVALAANFADDRVTFASISAQEAGAFFDTAVWDVAQFGAGRIHIDSWRDARKTGTYLSLHIESLTRDVAVTYVGCDFRFRPTGGLY